MGKVDTTYLSSISLNSILIVTTVSDNVRVGYLSLRGHFYYLSDLIRYTEILSHSYVYEFYWYHFYFR